MSNKDLLKQAIAEAKTIREAAITNAKEALEETLTPHLKEMLAQKLQEMEDMDEEVMDENIYEAEEEEVEAEEGEEGAEEEGEEGEEEELEIEDMSVEDLKDLIRDIVAQETGNDQEDEMGTDEEGPEGQDDMVSMDDSEEIDINELLAELEGMDEEKDYEMEEGLKDTFKKVASKVGSTLKTGNEKLEKFIDKGGAAIEKAGLKSPYGGTKAFQESKMEEDDMEEGLKDTVKKVGSAINKKLEKFIDKGAAGIEKAGLKSPYGGVKAFQEAKQDKADLQEALKAVRILRNQLQEVNLLNAKLLYVNKVFKSSNLSEGQKVNVIAAFDKAETVKEVKLVFETVSKNVVTKPVAIKEHRSFASKATGNANTTAPKEILSEVSEQVQRWQKLAGIIK
jgi:hypothetical protein